MAESYRLHVQVDGSEPVVGTAWFARLDRVITAACLLEDGARVELEVGEARIPLNVVVREANRGIAVLEPAGTMGKAATLAVGPAPEPLATWRAPGFPGGEEPSTPYGTVASVSGDQPSEAIELAVSGVLPPASGWLGAPVLVDGHAVAVVTAVDATVARAAGVAPLAEQLGIPVAPPKVAEGGGGTRLERMRRAIDNNRVLAVVVAVVGATAGLAGSAGAIIDFVKKYVVDGDGPQGELLVTTATPPCSRPACCRHAPRTARRSLPSTRSPPWAAAPGRSGRPSTRSPSPSGRRRSPRTSARP